MDYNPLAEACANPDNSDISATMTISGQAHLVNQKLLFTFVLS
jgi:hypothetical protein